jgi:hypothetical protein
MFHRSWGLMMIQSNIQAPCTLLDFPTRERFIAELRRHKYDIIGISSIPLNIAKVRNMCQLIRQYQPWAKIVVGGHIANVPDLDQRIDADHTVRGEGVKWFRRYLGEDEDQPIRHPQISSGVGTRCMGVQVKDRPGDVAATLIPSVGCPMGCNFCSTSAMFGGKGKFVEFYASGDQLFDVMCQLEAKLRAQSFFIADENFLLHRKRALRLLELMQREDKAWSLYTFSSARVLQSYTMDQLIQLGVSWVWMGLEGQQSQYAKLRNVDTFSLVRRLQAHGIHVLGSTIIGLENHTPDNMQNVIDYAARHNTDFHQFMLYTPVAGTPLYDDLRAQGQLKDESEFDPADIHGQLVFNYRHPHLPEGTEGDFIRQAFQRDFERNGPSLMRLVRTELAGWRRYKNHSSARVRRRITHSARELPTTWSAAVWATRRYYRGNPSLRRELDQLQSGLYDEFGWKARAAAAIAGPYVLWKLLREERRLARGWTYEPPTFYETNFEGRNAGARDGDRVGTCRYVSPGVAATDQRVSTGAAALVQPELVSPSLELRL